VRNDRQFDVAAEFGKVTQEGDDASVVALAKLFENQAGKQLRLGKLLGENGDTLRNALWLKRLAPKIAHLAPFLKYRLPTLYRSGFEPKLDPV
jgi:hypothetical protein